MTFSPLEALARISHELLQEPEESQTLQRVVALAVELIEGCDYCGISLRHAGGRMNTPAASDPLVEKCDALQYQLGEGPCLDAIWLDDVYLIPDMRAERRWPVWCPQAADLGVGSLLAVRLATHSGTLGCLKMYAADPRAFSNDSIDVAHVYAANAAAALAAAQRVTGLKSALGTRHMIGLAQGIIMQRCGVSLELSFEVLRRRSAGSNIKLRDIAALVVAEGGLPPDGTATAPCMDLSGSLPGDR